MTEFQETVQKALELDLTKDLALELQVSISTIRRWAAGTAEPLPRFKVLVINLINKKINALPK